MQELPKGGENPFADGTAKDDNLPTASKPDAGGATKTGPAKTPAKPRPAKAPGKVTPKKKQS